MAAAMMGNSGAEKTTPRVAVAMSPRRFKKIGNAQEIVVPRLNEIASEQVELAGVPFATFVANKKINGSDADYAFVLRGYVRHWLNNVWAEYDRVGVVDMIGVKSAGKPEQKSSSRKEDEQKVA